jgi:REP element-mobilizing transposase RayT
VSRLARVIVLGFRTMSPGAAIAASASSSKQAIAPLSRHDRRASPSVEVWAYCLMPNHVHLVMVPQAPDGVARAMGETHRQYIGFINARARTTGHRGNWILCKLSPQSESVNLAICRHRNPDAIRDWRYTSHRPQPSKYAAHIASARLPRPAHQCPCSTLGSLILSCSSGDTKWLRDPGQPSIDALQKDCRLDRTASGMIAVTNHVAFIF